MALRMILVSLVAGLGLNPTSVPRFSTWGDAARVWSSSRLARIEGQMPSGPDAFAPPDALQNPCPTPAENVETVVDASPETLTDVLKPIACNLHGAAVVAPSAAFDAPEDLYEGLAYLLNRQAEGWRPASSDFDLGSEVGLALNQVSEGLTSDAGPSVRPYRTASVESGSRLTQAVRLTREAVFAWASLLHAPAVVTISR